MVSIDQKSPTDITLATARCVKARRRELGLTQAQLAEKAGMSLASYKRFEQKGLIEFLSLAAIGIALGCENDFDGLFARQIYRSIDDVVASSRSSGRRPR